MFFCKHKWMPSADRVQTCFKCGKERAVECPHSWVKREVFTVSLFGKEQGEAWVMQCPRCGEVKTVRVGVNG